MDPVAKIKDDRREARGQEDSNADLCFLALADKSGPSVRTLVLRDIKERSFTLFINKTSPKWQAIEASPQGQLLLWYGSIQKQYRISGTITELDRSVITENWGRRPSGSKYLDLSYQHLGPQSSVIDSRQQLIETISQLKSDNREDDLTTPASATGVVLTAQTIECLDLNNLDRIHDRRLYTRIGSEWQEEILLP
jgi:pyridoxamine 5'-phosphate oxidase